MTTYRSVLWRDDKSVKENCTEIGNEFLGAITEGFTELIQAVKERDDQVFQAEQKLNSIESDLGSISLSLGTIADTMKETLKSDMIGLLAGENVQLKAQLAELKKELQARDLSNRAADNPSPFTGVSESTVAKTEEPQV